MADLKPQLANFNWPDPFLLDNQLNEDDRMLRDAAAQFAQNELQPLIVDAYREATVNPSLFPKMGEAGLLGATIPEEYGGLGASYTAYGLIAREVERVDSGYRSMMSVQSSLVIYPIHAYGSEVPHPCLWKRGPTAKILAGALLWGLDWVLRSDRAGCWI